MCPELTLRLVWPGETRQTGVTYLPKSQNNTAGWLEKQQELGQSGRLLPPPDPKGTGCERDEQCGTSLVQEVAGQHWAPKVGGNEGVAFPKFPGQLGVGGGRVV